ncbi:MAG: bifunctional riboflavin kinase/FAD synthetase [Chloroflexi bacterium]|nr:bifunctional riboflavin kinase/FAD synthetase [Chloroflexota bacterium]
MRIDGELAEVSPNRDSALTLGVFDGVHRGHQHLIRATVKEARKSGLLALVATFKNHPRSILQPGFRPSYITGLDGRISLMGALGVDRVVPITFDLELSELGARDFVALLQRRLRMQALVVGPDFALGRKREGDIATLTSLGSEMGFSLVVAELLEDDGRPVRSTVVRQALAEGDLKLVQTLLGRPFVLEGAVETGAGRGKVLGFPTANLRIAPDRALPGDGIYATWALVGERRHMAATSVGTRPTFGETDRTVEAFLLDFDGDLYGSEVRLEFVQRLRDDVKYDSAETLKDQIGRDVDETRRILGAVSRA